MKAKIICQTILIIFSLIFVSGIALANNTANHKSEIEEGRELAENKVSCDELSDEQLEAIGEYLMEQMHPGESHEAMHKTMGIEEGTEYHKQFHVNMAQMMYCGKNTMMGSTGMMGGPTGMMQMMGSWSNPRTSNLFQSNNMMGNMMTNFGAFGWWSWFGWIFMILFWILLIISIIALIKWLINQIRGETKSKSALDILKERYAKDEISKEEFEEKKKDLS